MRVLVTGGAGFIGSNLVDALLARGDEVTVIDDLSTGHRTNVDSRAVLVEGSITDHALVAEAVHGCDLVFHHAANRAVFRSVEEPLETDRTNVAGTLTVLVASRDAHVRRVISASSSSVYGGAQIVPTPEAAPLVPRSPYAVSKLAGEHYCRVFTELFGLETVCLRYFNVFGPRQRPDSQYAAVIPLFIDALRTGQQPEIHGDGHQSRHFVYVADVVEANLAIADAPSNIAGRAFNIAGQAPIDLLALLTTLEDIVETHCSPRFTDARLGDVRRSHADLAAAREAFGFHPKVSMTEGLRSTVEWFQQRDLQVERPQ
jgi:UDP-N-acetylglucosamine/UDP-N-acetyl-alpha-D-glucosaminouronate 4-epimerase